MRRNLYGLKCFWLAATVLLVGTLASTAQAAPKADLWPHWSAHNDQWSKAIDHSRWQQLLDQRVHKNADGINRVSYKQFSAVEKNQLASYIQALAGLAPTQMNRAEQLAYWINLYNALTVQVVLNYPKAKSILKMKSGFFSIGPWGDELLTIEGKAVTLNDIEHRILRPIWQDHRLHFALNCASIGCPNLSKIAYTSSNAQAQLLRAQAEYLNHPRGVSLRENKLQLSSIFDWYQVDFAGDEKSLKAYLAAQLPQQAESILASENAIDYAYDWDLNEQKSPQ
ncbi:MAG: DUF547 domain-containing protein [Pseudomonadales bacterium]|jgi:hypothetical protein|tara:strand:- start:1921 stop:2766 length:846 start_codon:yes stop_codon:yes gene_type:complete